MSEDRFKARFDGAAAFAALPPAAQREIGGTAMEIVVNWNGQDAYADDEHRGFTRPYDAADSALLDRLHCLVAEEIPAVIGAEPMPVPSLLGEVCRRCGCSEYDPCHTDGVACHWAERDLCSACAAAPAEGEAA